MQVEGWDEEAQVRRLNHVALHHALWRMVYTCPGCLSQHSGISPRPPPRVLLRSSGPCVDMGLLCIPAPTRPGLYHALPLKGLLAYAVGLSSFPPIVSFYYLLIFLPCSPMLSPPLILMHCHLSSGGKIFTLFFITNVVK